MTGAADWYENVQPGSGPFQSQILADFRLLQPTYRTAAEGSELIEEACKVILLTQSCDLIRPETEGSLIVHRVLVAPVLPVPPKFAKSDNWSAFPNFKQVQYHWLPADERFAMEYSIIPFALTTSVPFDVIKRYADASRSLKLRDPFAEQLASRFGWVFARIGLPEPWYDVTQYKAFTNELRQQQTGTQD